MERHYLANRVEVKLFDQVIADLSGSKGILRSLLGKTWEKLCEDRTVLFDPVFQAIPSQCMGRLLRMARLYDPMYQPPEFYSFFTVSCSEGIDEIIDFFASCEVVEYVQRVEVAEEELPICSGLDDCYADYESRQGYLGEGPVGVDARHSWNLQGGSGEGVGFASVDESWHLKHQDFPTGIKVTSGGVMMGETTHGTKTLGVVVARRNGFGITGIAHCVDSIAVSPIWRKREDGEVRSEAEAIVGALCDLSFGDVLLLEMAASTGAGPRPIEIIGSVFEAIRLGAALGVSVIEPFGNGGDDLHDAFCHLHSGAIMVGATGPLESETQKYNIHPRSNYGERVDSYAWGEDIVTTSSRVLTDKLDHEGCYSCLDRTSGASAIIAGVVACLQGIARKNLGNPLGPAVVRRVLRNPASGFPVLKDGELKGIFPSLKKIANDVLGIDLETVVGRESY